MLIVYTKFRIPIKANAGKQLSNFTCDLRCVSYFTIIQCTLQTKYVLVNVRYFYRTCNCVIQIRVKMTRSRKWSNKTIHTVGYSRVNSDTR